MAAPITGHGRAEAGADGHAAEPRSKRVGGIERGVVGRSGKRLRLTGHVHQAGLQHGGGAPIVPTATIIGKIVHTELAASG